MKSTTKKNSPNRNTATITTPVVTLTSFGEGVTTLRISERTSRRKLVNSVHLPRIPPPNSVSAPGSCRFFDRSSPFSIATFVAMLQFLFQRLAFRDQPGHLATLYRLDRAAFNS